MLRGQGTYSIYTSVILELKNVYVKNAEKVIKNNFSFLKKTNAYLQTILKAHVKFQKDRFKTVVGVTGIMYLLPIRFCSIRTKKMSKLNMRKK